MKKDIWRNCGRKDTGRLIVMECLSSGRTVKSGLGKKKINQIFSKYKIAGAVWKGTVPFSC